MTDPLERIPVVAEYLYALSGRYTKKMLWENSLFQERYCYSARLKIIEASTLGGGCLRPTF